MTPPRLALPTETVGARSSSQGPSSLAALRHARQLPGLLRSVYERLGRPASGATPIGAVLAALVTPGPRGTFRIVVRASGCAVRITHRSGRLQVERLTGEPSAPPAPITPARPAPMMDDQSSARSSVADDEDHTQPVFAGTVGVDRSSRYATFLPWVPSGGLLPDAGWGSGRDARAVLAQRDAVTAGPPRRRWRPWPRPSADCRWWCAGSRRSTVAARSTAAGPTPVCCISRRPNDRRGCAAWPRLCSL